MRPFRALRSWLDPSSRGGFHWLHYIALLAIINVGLLLPIASGGRIASVGPVPLPRASTQTTQPAFGTIASKLLSADGNSTVRHLPPYNFQGPATASVPAATALPSPGSITTPEKALQAGYAWHVKGVILTNGFDASQLINNWGDAFHIWPVGIAATIGTESGYNPFAYRWQAGLDKSCGLIQLIVTNVEPVIHNYDPIAACEWEYNPANSIWLGARYYRDAFAYQHNCVPWPQAYGLFNAGYAWPCGWYFNMTGQAYNNYEFNFLPNYAWALQHFQNFGPIPPPPPPKPVHHYKFPKRFYEQHRRSHHLKPISPYYHHKLAFAPSVWWTVQNKKGREVLGGILRHEQFNRRRQVMTTSYQCGKIFTWPTHHGWPAKVQRHRCVK